MLTYQTELLHDVQPEIEALMFDHWRDVSDGSEGEPDPAWDTMLLLEDQGHFKVVTARAEDGRLVGYILYIVAYHLHYRTRLVAHDDAFFLHRDHRKGRNGIKMFQFAEQYLRTLGVHRITAHEKIRAPLKRFFNFLGYRNVEKNYFRDL